MNHIKNNQESIIRKNQQKVNAIPFEEDISLTKSISDAALFFKENDRPRSKKG